MAQSYEQILADLKNKVFHPVYFLAGEEPYFIDSIASYIEKNVLDESEKEFNQTILYGRDLKTEDIISHAKRFPMMSNYQVVIVKEAQEIKDLIGKAKAKDNDESPLISYLKNPQKSTLLVFCYKYKKLDMRTSIGKILSSKSVFLDSKPLYDNKIPDWINSYLKQHRYSVQPAAAALLTEYLGNNLSKISNELDKLMINVPQGTEISVEHIQSNIGISKEYNPFELQNAIGQKDILKANRIVQYFASNPKEYSPIMVISSLNGYFNKLLSYHLLEDKSRNTAAAALGVNPFFMPDYERAARNYNLNKVRHIFHYLHEYDLKSKGFESGNIKEGELLKELLFKILH